MKLWTLLPCLVLAVDMAAAQTPAPQPPMDLRPLGETSVGLMFYDAASIVRSGPMVSARVVANPLPGAQQSLPDGRTAASASMEFEYDCKARRMRLRAGTAYAGPSLTGEVVERVPAGDWTPIDWTRPEIPPGLYTVTCGAGR